MTDKTQAPERIWAGEATDEFGNANRIWGDVPRFLTDQTLK